MKFEEYIKESFNRPYKWKIISEKKINYIYGFFKDDGTKYQVEIDMWKSNKTTNNEIKKMLKKYTKHILNIKKYWTIDFSKESGYDSSSSFDITGSGNAQRVFATVLVIIKDFIKREKKPQFLFFSAENKSRVKLYNRMIKVFASKFGYKFLGIHKVRGRTDYILWNGKK